MREIRDRWSVISKSVFGIALSSMLLALCSPAEAQLPNRVPRIGHLNTSYLYNPGRREAFLQGLRELGYADRKNIVIEWRSSEGKPDRDPLLAAELVRLHVDVIVTGGSTPTRSAKEATVTIPIVMTQDSDPVGNGFVASLARPTKFEFVINLKAAKQIGLTIPPNALARADRVIK